jgi:hypothetical protein
MLQGLSVLIRGVSNWKFSFKFDDKDIPFN